MIPLDPPPQLRTPPALILPAQAETLERALARAGVARRVRREIVRDIERSGGSPSREVLSRVMRDDAKALAPVLLALLAARRQAGGVVAVPKALTYRASGVDPANTATHSVSSLAIGEGFAGRVVLFGVSVDGANSGTAIDEVAVGANVATPIVQLSDSFGNGGIFALVDEESTTVTVDVSSSSPKARCGVGVWTASGLSSLVPHDTDTSAADPSSVSLDTLEGGFAIAVATNNNGATLTFTGAGVTERYNGLSEGGNGRYAGADAPTSGEALAIGGTWTGNTSNGTPFVAASF